MSHLPIPLAIVYAGLAGTLIALVVATATNKWSPRVFFLLALRLAIGWHFMFEGFHKIHSYYTGPTETNRPFSSEPYFKVAPGPLGERMRNEFSNPGKEIATKVKAPKDISRDAFDKLTPEEQAAECPKAVAEQFDALQPKGVEAIKAEVEKELKDAETNEARALKEADEVEQRALKGEWTPDDFAQIRSTADAERRKIRAAADTRRTQIRERLAAYEQVSPELIGAAKMQPDGAMLVAQLEAVLKGFKAQADTDLKAIAATETKALDEVTATEQRTLKAEWTEADRAKIRAKAEADRKKAKEATERSRELAKKKADTDGDSIAKRIQAAKAAYARWVYGVDPRAATVKFVSGETFLAAPQRLEHLDWVRHQAKAAEERQTDGLGNGTGTDSKRVAEFRTGAIAAEVDLARDANTFIAELKKDIVGKEVTETPEPSRGQLMDRVTMWFLVVVGAFLMGGLFTRVACVLAAGFLVMTYLAHPAFPWYPLPPNTEGNPVFINKNVIEALALVLLACYPTGRWLGLDAIVLRPFCKYKPVTENV